MCAQLAFNVVAQFLLGSRLTSGEVNDSLREDFYTLTEGLFALPIDLPGTNFRKALEVHYLINISFLLLLQQLLLLTLLRDICCRDTRCFNYDPHLGGVREKILNPKIVDKMFTEHGVQSSLE